MSSPGVKLTPRAQFPIFISSRRRIVICLKRNNLKKLREFGCALACTQHKCPAPMEVAHPRLYNLWLMFLPSFPTTMPSLMPTLVSMKTCLGRFSCACPQPSCQVWCWSAEETAHWLTPRKGVHLFRYFLPTMRTPVQLIPPHAYMHCYCFVVYALGSLALNAYTRGLWCMHWVSWHSMRTPQNNRNAYMHTHCGQQIPKRVCTLSWCKHVNPGDGTQT